MRGRLIHRALGLFLAVLLATPAAFCGDCCCSSTPAPVERDDAGHGCCASSKAASSETRAVSASGCDCPELVQAPVDAVRLLGSVSPEFKDHKSPRLAIVVDASYGSDRSSLVGEAPHEPGARLLSRARSVLGARAPPASFS